MEGLGNDNKKRGREAPLSVFLSRWTDLVFWVIPQDFKLFPFTDADDP